MTSVNHFNTNRLGPDIEFVGFFDGDTSRTRFEENFTTLVQESYRKTAIYFYNPHGEFDQDEGLSFKIKVLKKDLIKFVENYVNSCADNTWLKQELYDEAMSFLTDELPSYKYDLEKLGEEYGLPLSFVNDIEILITRGYSQGDYALVLLDRTQQLKIWEKAPSIQHMKESIDHQFWDSPIYCKLEIDGTEYYYYDYVESEYEWKKDEFITKVAKASGVSLKALEQLVPSELSYV